MPDVPTLAAERKLKLDAATLLAAGDLHGTDPNCVGCHYRLDPLARFFDGWRPPYPGSVLAVYDPDQKAAGTLVERDARGSARRSSGQGETDLAKILLDSPNVHYCIAKRVWGFVQGPGTRLDPGFGTELVNTFKKTDSLRSVVSAAVKHPYFWSTERPPAMNFADIKRNFDTCVSCHTPSGPIKPNFDPRSYPFAANSRENVELLSKIFGAINRDERFKAMPPLEAAALSPEALALIRQWIVAGAHDNNNNATLNDDEIKEVLGE